MGGNLHQILPGCDGLSNCFLLLDFDILIPKVELFTTSPESKGHPGMAQGVNRLDSASGQGVKVGFLRDCDVSHKMP